MRVCLHSTHLLILFRPTVYYIRCHVHRYVANFNNTHIRRALSFTSISFSSCLQVKSSTTKCYRPTQMTATISQRWRCLVSVLLYSTAGCNAIGYRRVGTYRQSEYSVPVAQVGLDSDWHNNRSWMMKYTGHLNNLPRAVTWQQDDRDRVVEGPTS